MPYRQRGSSRRGLGLRPVKSTKNVVYAEASTGVTALNIVISDAVDTPIIGTANAVNRSCTIKRFWFSFDVCGLAATGVLQTHRMYIMSNPGANLTPPTPGTEGTSNEKKYIYKSWNAMTMRNQDGNVPYHWEGWIRVPKVYQRQGQNDQIRFVFVTTTAAGHLSFQAIYKWFE